MDYQLIGGIAISIVGLHFIRKVLPWLYYNIIGPYLLGPKVDFKRLGEWAVVTGATDGIGKSYAKALAKRGLNLVLISRSMKKLDNVAAELKNDYQVNVNVIEIDFTGDATIYTKIKEKLEGLEVGVLVNNVGISYPYPEYFLETYKKDPKFLRDIIAANVHSVTHMTALVLEGMINRKKGVIINVSSTAGVVPNPLLSVYSATKAFVNKFSADLQTEYKKNGIIVQSVQPGFVATNMTKIRKPTMFAPSPDTYVSAALKTVGFAEQTAGYFPHILFQMVLHSVCYVLGEDRGGNLVLNSLLATRKRALRNLAKKE